MRTLFFTFTYLKGNRGGIYASRTHINLFYELSESMTLLYPYKKGMDPEGINADIHKIAIEDKRTKIKKLFDLCRGIQSRFAYVADEYIKSGLYDTVVFDSSQTSSKIINKFKTAGFKIITIHHNYQIEFLKSDQKGLTKWLNILWTYMSEGLAVKKSDLNITLTQSDVELLKMHYCQTARFAVLGVFDSQRRVTTKIHNTTRAHNFVITGGLGAKQNEDSLIPWLINYYPLLKQIEPTATLTLAGRSPSERLTKVAKEQGAHVIPSPIDMNPILESGDYYICPTDRGGGLKLRIMDGLKSGMPVLTHSVSARGYERMEKAGIVFSYYDQNSFQKALKELLCNSMTKQEIQQIYLQQYSFETGIKVLEDILKVNNLI